MLKFLLYYFSMKEQVTRGDKEANPKDEKAEVKSCQLYIFATIIFRRAKMVQF